MPLGLPTIRSRDVARVPSIIEDMAARHRDLERRARAEAMTEARTRNNAQVNLAYDPLAADYFLEARIPQIGMRIRADRAEINNPQIRAEIAERMARDISQDIQRQIHAGLEHVYTEARQREDWRGRDYGALGERGRDCRINPLADYGRQLPKPIDFSWLQKYPATIEPKGLQGFTARLLKDERELLIEGDEMRHCIGRMYAPKIGRQEFIAFHVDCPKKITGSGITVTFKEQGGKWVYHDHKGKANREIKHKSLDVVFEVLERTINEVRETEAVTEQ